MVMDDKWAGVVAGSQISEGSVANSEVSFKRQLLFLYGDHPG